MPDPLRHYLRSHPPLRQLRTRLQEQQRLLQQVQHWLPAPLSSHCHSAVLQQTRLVLAADSPVWANQLRYQTPDLLHRLRTTHPSIAHIKVCSRPALNPSTLLRPTTTAQHHHDTSKPALLINNTACQIEDPTLSLALQKLADTLSN
ncbi:MAG: DUF721 domain-containing protein [Pseudomonadota bacterium]